MAPDAKSPASRRAGRPSDSTVTSDQLSADFIEAVLVKALLPDEGLRRRFLRAVGANTARAAIASVLPMGALQAMAQDKAPLEQEDR